MIFFLFLLLLALSAFIYYHFYIYPAHRQANYDVSEVSLLFGFLKVIYWEENEAVLLGRRKKVVYDSCKHPEMHELWIYPYLGDQVLARVKTGSELLAWEDSKKTFTKDGLRVQIDVAIRWKVINLRHYLYKINRSNYSGTDSHKHLKSTTTEWLSKYLESTMRRLVRDLTISELISSTIIFPSSEVEKEKDVENIALTVENILQKELHPFGLDIEKVEISDIQFEHHVQKVIDSIKIAVMEEQRSAHEGRSVLNKIQPLIDELGKDGVVLIEALKNMKGSMLFAPQQLSSLFGIGLFSSDTEDNVSKIEAKENKLTLENKNDKPLDEDNNSNDANDEEI